MLPEIGASELLVIAAVALIVVGPKDLPMLLRKLGQFMAKLRGLASEFRASFDEMARQSELDELRKEVEAMRASQLADISSHSPVAEVSQTLDAIHGEMQMHPPMSYQYADAPVVAEQPPAPKPRKPRAKKPVAAGGKGKAATKGKTAPKRPASPRKPTAESAR